MLLAHPSLAARSCDECAAHVYDRDGRLSTKPSADGRTRLPVIRPAGTPCVCGWTKGKSGQWTQNPHLAGSCPKESPVASRDLSPKNWQAFRYYLEIKAGAPMPDDRTARRNCALIRWAEDTFERGQASLIPLALGLLGKAK